MQTPHHYGTQRDEWTVVTERQPEPREWEDAEFAWRVAGHVTSNAIVLAKDRTAWGIGAGQQNRVESGQIAASKAEGRATGRSANNYADDVAKMHLQIASQTQGRCHARYP